jgi:periplasmic protein TonB
LAAALRTYPQAGGASRSVGAFVAIGLHLLAGVALISYEPARSALFAATPIIVDLITPTMIQPKPEPPVESIPLKPKPKPKAVVNPRPKPKEPQRVVAAPIEAPSPMAVEPLPRAPAPPPEPAPEPVVAAPPPPIVPMTPPVFNAAYLNNPPPAYPALSRRMGEEGRVVLRVLVNASGTADEVQILDSSGHVRLDEAARNTVRRWKFAPARRGERSIAAWVLIPISFRLEG